MSILVVAVRDEASAETQNLVPDQTFILLKPADLPPSRGEPDSDRRRIVEALRAHAARDQAQIRRRLDAATPPLQHQPFYVVNGILVHGTREQVEAVLQSPPELAPPLLLPVVMAESIPSSPVTEDFAPCEEDWNRKAVGVDRVSATGKGVTVGVVDTGVDWQHPALRPRYRGAAGGDPVSHTFNWHDATGSPPSARCPHPRTEPCDEEDDGHGTQVASLVAGSLDGVDFGVAPGASWVACRGLVQLKGPVPPLLECLQFMLAPYPPNGDPWRDGNPDLAPDVLVNSWGVDPRHDGNAWDAPLADALRSLRAAGILPVFAAGGLAGVGGHYNCGSVLIPARLPEAFAVGGITCGRAPYSVSGRGPNPRDPDTPIKPDVVAPALTVRTVRPGSHGFEKFFRGDSAAAPHAAGAVAVLWSQRPGLRGQVAQTEDLLRTRADQNLKHGNTRDLCGTCGFPSHVLGFGLIRVDRALEH